MYTRWPEFGSEEPLIFAGDFANFYPSYIKNLLLEWSRNGGDYWRILKLDTKCPVRDEVLNGYSDM